MDINGGFILTSHEKVRNGKTQLEFYGKGHQGPFKFVFPDQKHVFFLPTKEKFNPSSISYERKSLGFKNFQHESVDTIYLNNYSDLNKAKEYCEQNSIVTYELDVRNPERFLMERFINAEVEFQGNCEKQFSFDLYTSPTIRRSQSKQKIKLSTFSLDIETGIDGSLYSIAYHLVDPAKQIIVEKVLMRTEANEEDTELVTFLKTEKALLLTFIEEFKNLDPDIILGWHVIGFDLKFIEKKCELYNIELKLGRGNELLKIEERKGSGFSADLPGRIVLDGPVVLRSAFYQFKNFKLDTVAGEVLGTNKDISGDDGKVEEIERRFKEDKLSLAKYNILDCTLVTDIFEKLDLVNLLYQRSCVSGLLMDKLHYSTAAFDHVMLPRIHRKKYVAPNRIDIERDDASTGGMVLEPKPGLHENVAIFDFKSLYPTIMMSFKIDPFARIHSQVNTIKTPSGIEFSKTENILSPIIQNLMDTRELAKFNKNAALSMAVKILMNSFYGVMGSSRCRFYHSDLPTAITTTGHWILKEAIAFFNNRGLEVIYGDTDSLFVKCDYDEKEIAKLVEDLNVFFELTLKENFQTESKLECEFEKRYEQLYFPVGRGGQAAVKKRYVGIENRNIEFKGMDSVRSDSTELAKIFQKEIFELFFNKEELAPFIKNFIKKLEDGEFDKELIYTKRLSKDPKSYTKNIPIHVKAALKVNHTGPYRLKEVSYVITKSGPEPIDNNPTHYDYRHYIDKQLKPIADDILLSQGLSFESITLGDQLTFF